MKNFRMFAVVAMMALMVCSVVQAQDEAAPARGGQGGQGGRGGQQLDPAAQAQMVRFSLLRIEEVQAALELDDEAVEELNAALADAMPARGGRGGAGGAGGRPGQGGGAGGRGGDGGGATETADDTEAKAKREAAVESINKMLSEDQHTRLTGIVAQALQGRALQDKFIAEKLEITEDQAGEIKKVFDDTRAEMQSAMQDAAGDREAMMEAMQDIMKDANEAAIACLSDDQQKALEELKGEAVELPESATRMMMMGGGRGGMGGGRGGAGGQGGGGGGRPGAGGAGADGGNGGGGN